MQRVKKNLFKRLIIDDLRYVLIALISAKHWVGDQAQGF